MLNQNFASITNAIGANNRIQRTAPQYLDLAGALESYNKGYDRAQEQKQAQINADNKAAYIKALQGGNQDEINNAWANYDPQGYMQHQNEVQKLNNQFAQQKELANLNFGNQMRLAEFNKSQTNPTKSIQNYEYLVKQGVEPKKALVMAFNGNSEAVGQSLVDGTLGQKGQEVLEKKLGEQQAQRVEAANSAQQMNASIDKVINDVNNNPSIVGGYAPVREALNKYGLGGYTPEQALQRGAVGQSFADIKKDMIARAKASGQSGINTAREIEQVTAGIDANSSPAVVKGALNRLKEINNRIIAASKMPNQNDSRVQMALEQGYSMDEISQYLNGR